MTKIMKFEKYNIGNPKNASLVKETETKEEAEAWIAGQTMGWSVPEMYFTEADDK